jgi:hypothetical protein
MVTLSQTSIEQIATHSQRLRHANSRITLDDYTQAVN